MAGSRLCCAAKNFVKSHDSNDPKIECGCPRNVFQTPIVKQDGADAAVELAGAILGRPCELREYFGSTSGELREGLNFGKLREVNVGLSPKRLARFRDLACAVSKFLGAHTYLSVEALGHGPGVNCGEPVAKIN